MSNNGEMKRDKYQSGFAEANGARLRNLEGRVQENDKDVAVLKEKVVHFATKEDLANLKLWVYGTILTVIFATITIVLRIPTAGG